MERELLTYFQKWRNQTVHLPILLRGARQVGKTYLVEHFGRNDFEQTLSINFEESPEYLSCFETLKPSEIITKIQALSKQTIIPNKTLLFLDEIQVCPNAIMALRYFKEKMPELHVIGAGSLLEFALAQKGFSMPVGRVQYLYLKPLSFREYLKVTGHDHLIEYLQTATLAHGVSDTIHQMGLKLVQEYMNIGGMPMVVSDFLENQDLQTCQEFQTTILRTYSDDFSKYAKTERHKYLQQVYDKSPGLVGEQVKYVNISPTMDSRYLKDAVNDLNKAGVIFPLYSTSASGLPLLTHINEKKFKLLFLDIGLLKRSTKLDMELLFANNLMLLNRGALAEQFVGQELLAYQNPYDEAHLYYWSRDKKSSTAEVDYVINIDSHIIPIEVKSGKTGSLKSLHLLMKERDLTLGVRISSKPLQNNNNIISVPFYMIDQLPRLIYETGHV